MRITVVRRFPFHGRGLIIRYRSLRGNETDSERRGEERNRESSFNTSDDVAPLLAAHFCPILFLSPFSLTDIHRDSLPPRFKNSSQDNGGSLRRLGERGNSLEVSVSTALSSGNVPTAVKLIPSRAPGLGSSIFDFAFLPYEDHEYHFAVNWRTYCRWSEWRRLGGCNHRWNVNFS